MGKKIVRCLEAFDLSKHHDPRVRGIEIVGEERNCKGNANNVCDGSEF